MKVALLYANVDIPFQHGWEEDIPEVADFPTIDDALIAIEKAIKNPPFS